jgi:hypothetical protein
VPRQKKVVSRFWIFTLDLAEFPIMVKQIGTSRTNRKPPARAPRAGALRARFFRGPWAQLVSSWQKILRSLPWISDLEIQ